MSKVISSSRALLRTAIALTGVTLFCSTAAFAQSNPKCTRVFGFFREQAATTGCESPVGLCTTARYQGLLSGDSLFTATEIIPFADTQTTGVIAAAGDTTLTNARLGLKRGTLTIKNAAVFHTAGSGELLDIQTIVGGTGDFEGATGVLRAVGNFVDGSGTSFFDGSVCLP
jgi:hypothetical protein